VIVATVLAAAVAGLAWQLLRQDQDLERQRQQVALEQAADAGVAAMQQSLSALQERLTSTPPDVLPKGTLVVAITNDVVTAEGQEWLLYYPAADSPHGAVVGPSQSIFDEGTRLEFRERDLARAVAEYRRLRDAGDAEVRAGALLRLARVHRKRGDLARALAAYDALDTLDSTVTEGLPASLVARLGRIGVFDEAANASDAARESLTLLSDLQRGRWRLTQDQYESYADLARQHLSSPPADDPKAAARTAAAVWLWQRRNVDAPVSRRLVTSPSGPALVMWTATSGRLKGLVADSTAVTAMATEAFGSPRSWAIADLEGQLALGESRADGPTAIRTASTSGLPWTLHVFRPDGRQLPASPRRPLLMSVLAVVAVILGVGSYAIARSIAREQRLRQLQSDFVAAVSHEFRTPLTSLSHIAALLAADRLGPEALKRESYDVLVRDTARLRRLVEDLLEFSRFEAGAVTFRRQAADVAALARETVTQFQAAVAADGYTIELAGDAGPIHADVDRDALVRALWNLLDNAVKYSPETRIVQVDVHREDGHLAIAVRDRGIGIPEHERARIFERFVRGSESKVRQIRGTGIGLAMVRHIVEAHGGRIDVESQPGHGSVFTMSVPVAAEVELGPGPAARIANEGRAS
jgi:signal transduction histidine kinase